VRGLCSASRDGPSKKQFLLKFSRDRRRYLHWVFKANKRFDLSVLNYMETSNHVHLLLKDTGWGCHT